ncbi:MAG: glutathione peroxidase [Gammaproteobacteria bacterium]|nr:glutathione peroxidase [Gammaproteobacteria bacterium]
MFKQTTLLILFLLSSSLAVADCPDFLDHDLKKLHSNETINLCEAAFEKTLLIINTASYCGYTKQFEGLESLHQKYHGQGLFLIGFTSNDFNQEASTEKEASRVCRLNYGVTFMMIAPSSVKGRTANPVFTELNKKTEEPNWNFNKYLVSYDRNNVTHFPSHITPDSDELTTAIETALSNVRGSH